MSPLRWIPVVLCLLPLIVAGCKKGDGADTPAEEEPALDPAQVARNADLFFDPLPTEVPNPANPLTEEKITLGRMLFFETRLSRSGTVSCNSCHALDKHGVDGEAVSDGHDGISGTRNSPTVYNAALHFRQFWDGREPDVEAQAKGPIVNPIEMGLADSAEVERKLRGIPEYQPLFVAAFPDDPKPLTFDNAARAIGAFERKLVTPGRFDRFLAGEHDVLDAQEIAGLQGFIDAGCTACHLGPTLGGSMYQKMGLLQPFETEDGGRFEVTGQDRDKGMFKVPGLRDVAATGPYFHDGSVPSLEAAIALMDQHQTATSLSAEEQASIQAFLGSLTGTPDPEYIAPPTLPGM
jgi:cytochrome c peroxidase